MCDGKFIGIESIYTVVEGKQINIPDKLATLRARSRKNELFCPCGCGSNLILVASENNLREQHFRLKTGEFNKECQTVTEGKRSVDSKIILKCWLDDKLHDESIESRVPIADVSETDRRFEFTFLSKTKAIGISYCHDRVNVSDIKLKLLGDNSTGISLVHILDACNFKADGQYPEAEMKIQDIQGYFFLLDIGDELDYFDAEAAIRESNSIRERLEQQAERVVDSKGVRWIKCEFCGLIATEGSFSSYGGANHINLGTCKECQANNPEAQISRKMMNQSKAVAKKRDPYECPQCGGRIVEKVGRYGKFLSCSNYPRCDYKPPRRW